MGKFKYSLTLDLSLLLLVWAVFVFASAEMVNELAGKMGWKAPQGFLWAWDFNNWIGRHAYVMLTVPVTAYLFERQERITLKISVAVKISAALLIASDIFFLCYPISLRLVEIGGMK